MSDFYVPKRRVTTEAMVLGMERRVWDLFLSETAASHIGPERPSDLLNQSNPFLAVKDAEAGFVIVSISHIISISVPVDAEFNTAGLGAEDLAAASSTSVEVDLLIETGDVISGTLVYIQPIGQQRVQDFMNVAPDFISVRDGETAHIVNTRRIVQVSMRETPASADAREEPASGSIDDVFGPDEGE